MKHTLFMLLAMLFTQTTFAQEGHCDQQDIEIPASINQEEDRSMVLNLTELKDIHLTIFDATGKKMHEVEVNVTYTPKDLKDGRKYKEIDTDWTAKEDMNGQAVKLGTYFYALDGKCIDGGAVRKTGSIRVINE